MQGGPPATPAPLAAGLPVAPPSALIVGRGPTLAAPAAPALPALQGSTAPPGQPPALYALRARQVGPRPVCAATAVLGGLRPQWAACRAQAAHGAALPAARGPLPVPRAQQGKGPSPWAPPPARRVCRATQRAMACAMPAHPAHSRAAAAVETAPAAPWALRRPVPPRRPAGCAPPESSAPAWGRPSALTAVQGPPPVQWGPPLPPAARPASRAPTAPAT